MEAWRFIKIYAEIRRACFALNGHPYLCGCEISDVLKATATSQSLANAPSNKNAPRNPQGNTEATERNDTGHLIPISPVRLSSTARAPKPVEAHTADRGHPPRAAAPNANVHHCYSCPAPSALTPPKRPYRRSHHPRNPSPPEAKKEMSLGSNPKLVPKLIVEFICVSE